MNLTSNVTAAGLAREHYAAKVSEICDKHLSARPTLWSYDANLCAMDFTFRGSRNRTIRTIHFSVVAMRCNLFEYHGRYKAASSAHYNQGLAATRQVSWAAMSGLSQTEIRRTSNLLIELWELAQADLHIVEPMLGARQ